jgi:RNA polymerase sporulation-specific sigma factor
MNGTEELIFRAQNGDREAGELLVQGNSGLIWSVAKRFMGRGADADDLYQLGCLGFLKAVEGFDVSFGTQFSTYAVPKIAGEIRRFLRDDGAVKVSRSIKERANVIKSSRNQLITALGREPTVQEISRQTGFSVEDIAVAEMATSCVESMYQESNGDSFSLENMLSDTESEEVMLEKIALRQGIEKLSEREAMVIRLRYYHSLTQEKVSRILGVSQVQISRIEKKALSNLRVLIEQ